MNNLTETCHVGLAVGRNYVRWLITVIISRGLEGAKR